MSGTETQETDEALYNSLMGLSLIVIATWLAYRCLIKRKEVNNHG